MNFFASVLMLLSAAAVLSAAVLVFIRLLYDIGINIHVPSWLKNTAAGCSTACSPKGVHINKRKAPDSPEEIIVGKPEEGSRYMLFMKLAILSLLSRAAIYITGYMGYISARNKKLEFLASFKELWNKWDSPHYLSIAQHWYQNVNDERFFIVFYPLYPAVTKIVSFVIQDYFYSGVFVSILFLITAAFYAYKLMQLEYGDREMSYDAVKYLLIFPFSFFCGIAYTESLFIVLSLAVFYYARKRKWLAAGIIGMLAALTRNQGLILALPVFMEMFLDENTVAYLKEKQFSKVFEGALVKIGCLLLIPAGTAVYMLINKTVTGDWLKFLVYQREHWNNRFGFFAYNIMDSFLNIFRMDPGLAVGVWAPQVVLFFAALALICVSVKKFRLSYTAFALAYLVVSYSPTWLLSGPRYITGLAPLYMFLAAWTGRKYFRRLAVDFTMIILLGLFTTAFVLGYVF